MLFINMTINIKYTNLQLKYHPQEYSKYYCKIMKIQEVTSTTLAISNSDKCLTINS